jgi:hypothetical protein
MRTFFVFSAFLLQFALACEGQISGGADAGPPGSEGEPACIDHEPVGGSLVFDGVDDHVSMGVAPALGLSTFTVEAWVKREGRGSVADTGVGGLKLVPIAGKGRGEGDGSTVDCNYAFGFAGDVLGADFEDMASGANHPVLGKTEVPLGEWHHVAATYDGATWRLYLDGRLDAERTVNATPRADSIQHFAIGTALTAAGTPAGRLHGSVDEVRVWNVARSGEQLATWMFTPLRSAPGLVSRWALDRGSEMDDITGAHPGTLAGATPSDDDAGIGRGLPPVLAAAGPADGLAVAGSQIELAVELTNPDRGAEPLTTVFHVREIEESDDFTIVVLPDTQYYTVSGRGLEQYFYDQTQWIRDHRAEYNIVAVIHNGDLVDHGDRYQAEWTVANAAMSKLETPEDGLPDGVPYGISVGNHDQTPNGEPSKTLSFNQHFGVGRFAGRAYYGGHYGSRNDDSWFTFSAGGLDFVVVNLQFDTSQDPAVLAWARSIFQMHPGAFGILNSHYLLGSGGGFGPQGGAIYAGLKGVKNLQLMTCGHIGAEARRTDIFEDHPIHTMLADYQFDEAGGAGKLRIWEFSPVRDELTVRTYSPSRDEWQTDENSEFTLPVDLTGAGGEFDDLLAVDGADRITATWTGLEPGRTYEWYASASDCAHTVSTPVYRFTTVSGTEKSGSPRQKPSHAERAKQIRHPPLRPIGSAVPIED